MILSHPLNSDPTPVCPSGFILLNTTCYYFSERSATRGDAQDSCASVGATLASPSTAEEDATVAAYLNSLGGGINYWIGITQHNALQFEWMDGSPLEDTFWGDEFDPNNERTNCIRMDASYGFHWHDKSCGGSLFNFICEAPSGGESMHLLIVVCFLLFTFYWFIFVCFLNSFFNFVHVAINITAVVEVKLILMEELLFSFLFLFTLRHIKCKVQQQKSAFAFKNITTAVVDVKVSM